VRTSARSIRCPPSALFGDPFIFQPTSEVCGDADGNGRVTVTDGVQVLRAAAGLSSSCPEGGVGAAVVGTAGGACDVDGNGAISVTDGVNVLRLAAGLPVELRCAF
jgi:hypothetical protein